jgi:hypothetical protein
MLSSLSSALNISWVDPLEGTRERVGGLIAPQRIRSLAPLNLDDDLESELLLVYQYGSTILDFAHGIQGSYGITHGPDCFADYGAWHSSDIDLDGHPDIIHTSYGLVEFSSATPEGWTVRHLLMAESTLGISLVDYYGAIWRDVDRDGDLDLLAICGDGIRVHLNDQIEGSTASAEIPSIRIVSGNPGRNPVDLAVRVGESGVVSMGLHDVSGRRIWGASRHALGQRWFRVTIDPKSQGRPLASGVYFFRVEGGDRAATRRIVLAR